jgi:hypothetical protein
MCEAKDISLEDKLDVINSIIERLILYEEMVDKPMLAAMMLDAARCIYAQEYNLDLVNVSVSFNDSMNEPVKVN